MLLVQLFCYFRAIVFCDVSSGRIAANLCVSTEKGGLNIAGEDDSYDFGSGAGFYLDATKAPWNKGYKMYSYVRDELPKTVFQNFNQIDSERVSIFGHSMGGHGALTLFLQNPGLYKSVSAYAPIANPSNCPWGQKAFEGYLNDKSEWAEYDATELVKKWKGGPLDILIDVVRFVPASLPSLSFSLPVLQTHEAFLFLPILIFLKIEGAWLKILSSRKGTADNFYHQSQLLPENFQKAAAETQGGEGGVRIRFQEGYDHSYFTMASFADDHVGHAARYLLG